MPGTRELEDRAKLLRDLKEKTPQKSIEMIDCINQGLGNIGVGGDWSIATLQEVGVEGWERSLSIVVVNGKDDKEQTIKDCVEELNFRFERGWMRENGWLIVERNGERFFSSRVDVLGTQFYATTDRHWFMCSREHIKMLRDKRLTDASIGMLGLFITEQGVELFNVLSKFEDLNAFDKNGRLINQRPEKKIPQNTEPVAKTEHAPDLMDLRKVVMGKVLGSERIGDFGGGIRFVRISDKDRKVTIPVIFFTDFSDDVEEFAKITDSLRLSMNMWGDEMNWGGLEIRGGGYFLLEADLFNNDDGSSTLNTGYERIKLSEVERRFLGIRVEKTWGERLITSARPVVLPERYEQVFKEDGWLMSVEEIKAIMKQKKRVLDLEKLNKGELESFEKIVELIKGKLDKTAAYDRLNHYGEIWRGKLGEQGFSIEGTEIEKTESFYLRVKNITLLEPEKDLRLSKLVVPKSDSYKGDLVIEISRDEKTGRAKVTSWAERESGQGWKIDENVDTRGIITGKNLGGLIDMMENNVVWMKRHNPPKQQPVEDTLVRDLFSTASNRTYHVKKPNLGRRSAH